MSSTVPRAALPPAARNRRRGAAEPGPLARGTGSGTLGLLTAAALLLAACRSKPSEPTDTATSPQARAEPAPLATAPAGANSGSPDTPLDAGPPPAPLRSDEALPPDLLAEAVREPGGREGWRDVRDVAGVSLQAIVRTGEGPVAPRAAEVNGAAIESARRKTEARISIELGMNRGRFALTQGFVLVPGTELRARADRYGYVVLVADAGTYRVAPPGAIRALLAERRLDVAPLSAPEVHPSGEGPRRLNLPTRRIEVTTRAARATFEIAALREAGESGVLVCRFLLELMSATPSASVCSGDEVPLHAELRWTTRGALTFDVTAASRTPEIAAAELAAPPATRRFDPAPLPMVAGDLLLPRGELAAFRTAAADMPMPDRRDAQTPPEMGLLLSNASDELRVVWIDGAPVAWVAPGARVALPMLVRGRYALQWRTFLGDAWESPESVVTPATSEVGNAH